MQRYRITLQQSRGLARAVFYACCGWAVQCGQYSVPWNGSASEKGIGQAFFRPGTFIRRLPCLSECDALMSKPNLPSLCAKLVNKIMLKKYYNVLY